MPSTQFYAQRRSTRPIARASTYVRVCTQARTYRRRNFCVRVRSTVMFQKNESSTEGQLYMCNGRGVRNGQKSRTLLREIRQKSTEINVRNQKSVGNRKSEIKPSKRAPHPISVNVRYTSVQPHRARAKPSRDERNGATRELLSYTHEARASGASGGHERGISRYI